jgi:hypothetical protein
MRGTTVMQLIPDPRRPGIIEYATIDPFQLEAALALDAALASMSEPENAPSLIEPPAHLAHSGESVVYRDFAGTKP